MIKKIFPHTTSAVQVEEEKVEGTEVMIKDKTKGHHRDKIILEFWNIYNDLEDQVVGNGNGKIVNHDILHNGLVSSGKFYAGEATQIINDMVNDGRLKAVSYHEYKKVNGSIG